MTLLRLLAPCYTRAACTILGKADFLYLFFSHRRMKIPTVKGLNMWLWSPGQDRQSLLNRLIQLMNSSKRYHGSFECLQSWQFSCPPFVFMCVINKHLYTHQDNKLCFYSPIKTLPFLLHCLSWFSGLIFSEVTESIGG